MEGITNIEKTKEDIERCKNIIQDVLGDVLSEELYVELTKEIMDTSLFIGGDFSDDNIRNLAIQYKDSKGLERFIKAHK